MSKLGPMIFRPLFKPKIWGGRSLQQLLGKNLPPDQPIGESWELVDLEEDQSIIDQGTSAGKALGALVAEHGKDLLGDSPLFEGRFPLLIKFLDACDTLSLQVHPTQEMANRMGGNVRVKNEAWYILDARPDGFIYRGMRPGADEAALRNAIEQGETENVLNKIPVKKSQCYYLPSGTLHALGAGVVVAEVQTPSDITYRVSDWNRIDSQTGKPRELHVEQAMACVDFSGNTILGEQEEHVDSPWEGATRLVKCDSFVIDRARLGKGNEEEIPYRGMMIWIVLEGKGSILDADSDTSVRFSVGDTVLLPSSLRRARLLTHDNCMWLEVSVPLGQS